MQSLDTDIQALGGNGGFGGGNYANNPLLWILTLGFLSRNNGIFGGGGDASVGVAENSAKLDCLAQGHAALQNSINQTTLAQSFERVSGQMSELAGISRDQTTLLSGINRDTQDTIFRETSAIQRSLAECCCRLEKGQSEIQTAIALQTNTLVMNENANTQKILDRMCNDTIEALRTQNQNLQRELGIAETVKQITQACGCCGDRGGPGNSIARV